MVRRLALTNVCPERLIFLQYNYLAEKLRDFGAGSAVRLPTKTRPNGGVASCQFLRVPLH